MCCIHEGNINCLPTFGCKDIDCGGLNLLEFIISLRPYVKARKPSQAPDASYNEKVYLLLSLASPILPICLGTLVHVVVDIPVMVLVP